MNTGCTACHSVSVYDIRSVPATGPDLSVAVEDVPKRFGRSLEDFLRAPTGTMAMVLSGRIPLTDQKGRRRREAGDASASQELSGAGRPAEAIDRHMTAVMWRRRGEDGVGPGQIA